MRRAIYDRFGSVIKEVHTSHDGVTFVHRELHDPLLEATARLRDARQHKDIKLVAKIPATVVAQAMREGWFNDRKAWKRWLNDSDNRAFRVYQGSV
jgi:hypothetical protein